MLGFTASTNAFIRHVYSFLGGAAALAGLAGVSPDTFASIVTAIHQIGDGVSSIMTGLGTLVPLAAGAYAAFTATRKQQIKTVNAMPDVQVVPASATVSLTGQAKASAHWLVTLLAIAVCAPLLGGCLTTLPNGQQVTVTPANFLSVVQADAIANCPALQALANAADVVAQPVAAVVNDSNISKTADQVSSASTSACNKVTGQINTGTTTVAPVPATPAPAATAPSTSGLQQVSGAG
ncbi:MAG TPA: hypothetical protein VMI56_17065 [Reyranella sp.]|nr:hypothetical protein [Reyranella sp.]